MHLMVNTSAMIEFCSSKRKIFIPFCFRKQNVSVRDDFVEKKCLSHLRKIAAGTSEDLLRNLCLCLLKNPFRGVDRDPVISPPRFLHDLVGATPRILPTILQLPHYCGKGDNPSYTNNTILKIISLIKLSQSQVPGIVMDTVYSFNVATTPIYAGFGWINCV